MGAVTAPTHKSPTHLPLHVELIHAINRGAEESARKEQEKGSRKPHGDLYACM